MTQVWQIAAGDGTRNYTELFLKHGLACVGPGDPGPYDQKPENYSEGRSGHRPFMRPFCTELVRDDLLLLKRGAAGGLWAVEAIGRVDGPYTYEPRLEDVEGWDLQHSMPVRWRVPDEPRLISGLTRGTSSASRRARFSSWPSRCGTSLKAPSGSPSRSRWRPTSSRTRNSLAA